MFATAARFYTGMGLANRHRPIANLVVSNVPGPDFPLYLAGAELVAGFPLGPVMDGMGVNITIMSYRGVLYWGIIACPEVMPRTLGPGRRHRPRPRRALGGGRSRAGHAGDHPGRGNGDRRPGTDPARRTERSPSG